MKSIWMWVFALLILIVVTIFLGIYLYLGKPTTSTYVCDISSSDLMCMLHRKLAIPGCTFVYNEVHNCNLFSCSEAPECCGNTYNTCGVTIYGVTYDVTDCEWYEGGVLKDTIKRGESKLIPSGISSNMYGYKCAGEVGCTPDTYRCSADKAWIQRCIWTGSKYDWVNSYQCPTGMECQEFDGHASCVSKEWCGDGICQADEDCISCPRDCPAECTADTYKCNDDKTAIMRCNICKWEVSLWCPSGQVCQEFDGHASCITPCINECSPKGARRCLNSNTYQVCGDYDADACLEWGGDTTCPEGQICINGQCGTVSGVITLIFLGGISAGIIGGIALIILKILGKI
mgnify:CR=1 FL=1